MPWLAGSWAISEPGRARTSHTNARLNVGVRIGLVATRYKVGHPHGADAPPGKSGSKAGSMPPRLPKPTIYYSLGARAPSGHRRVRFRYGCHRRRPGRVTPGVA